MSKRQVFLSFHYEEDNWRVNQIKNMGVIEGQKILSSNEWESIKRENDNAIKQWIDKNMKHRSCVIVLIGKKTANRKWVKYEIKKAWDDGKALLGIYIHNLKDENGNTTEKGKNPFDIILDSKNILVKDPDPNDAYNDIKNNLKEWVEKSINGK